MIFLYVFFNKLPKMLRTDTFVFFFPPTSSYKWQTRTPTVSEERFIPTAVTLYNPTV